jgi:hypothetical protein
MPRHTLLAALLLCLPTVLSGQSHPLVGTWNVTVPAGVRIDNGEPAIIVAKGTLAVTVVGDSLIGTLNVEPPEGLPARPASRLAARRASGPTTFVSVTQATLNVNGSESQRSVTSTYIVESSDGDAFKGTVTRIINGLESPMSTPQPFNGTRVGGAG